MKTHAPLRRFQRCYFVYILSSLSGTLYVGLTDDLRNRIMQHKAGTFDGFTKKYNVNRLMYFETYTDSKLAESREKQIKKWRRGKKVALFAESNPEWRDLTPEIFETIGIPRCEAVKSIRSFAQRSRTASPLGIPEAKQDWETP